MKIGILCTDDVRPELVKIYGDYPSMFECLLHASNVSKTSLFFTTYETHKGEFPESIHDEDAFLITGSKLSVYDKVDWINSLEKFIGKLFASNKKIVGICFGHQIIAQSLGGKVEKSRNGWQIGVRTAHSVATPSEEQNNLGQFNLIYSHQDEVKSAPEAAEISASTETCQNVMMKIGNNVLTFQGHPEFSVEYALELLKLREDLYDDNHLKEARKSLKRLSADDEKVGRLIIDFLLK